MIRINLAADPVKQNSSFLHVYTVKNYDKVPTDDAGLSASVLNPDATTTEYTVGVGLVATGETGEYVLTAPMTQLGEHYITFKQTDGQHYTVIVSVLE